MGELISLDVNCKTVRYYNNIFKNIISALHTMIKVLLENWKQEFLRSVPSPHLNGDDK